MNLYHPPGGDPFTATIANEGEFFALTGAIPQLMVVDTDVPVLLTAAAAVNGDITNTLVLQGRAHAGAQWVDLVTITVNALTNYKAAAPVYLLPLVRLGWRTHTGSSSGVEVFLNTSVRSSG